ncbi:MAG: hypothetical protein IJD91_01295 [Clostridia bacterium]|nr:hypothetical protein [Clostridia bacterium]
MEGNSMALDIQRFAEGSGEGASAAVNSAEVGQPQNSGEAVVNDTAGNVPDAGEQTGANAEAGEEVTLDSFFQQHPEAKKENDKRIQSIVQKRMHQVNKSMQGKNDIIDKLMVAHGVKSVEELSKKLDDSLAEEFAIKNGVDNDIGREMFNLRLNEKRIAEERAYYENQKKADIQYEKWKSEADELRSLYPDMDLAVELENPDFVRLLTATDEQYRMPMKQIYEMIHHAEIVEAEKKKTAAAYAQSVNKNISRPVENGVGNQNAVSHKSDVSKLTRKERAELAKRAMRGETISF